MFELAGCAGTLGQLLVQSFGGMMVVVALGSSLGVNQPPSLVVIFYTLQKWQLGSSRVGAGLTIELDEQHYLGNYAKYQRVTTPTQP